jgi:ATP-dependent DNA helicase RecG
MKELDKIEQKIIELLKSPENEIVDFKEKPSGIKAETIVAFANSGKSCFILAGVRESINDKGQQYGEVVGCDTSDKVRLDVLNKASSCIPPISIDISVQNNSENPILVVEIYKSIFLPHCTGDGTYKIRNDGRNSTLVPEQLLQLFLQKETNKFIENFRNSTEKLERSISAISERIDDQSVEIFEYLERVNQISKQSNEIADENFAISDSNMSNIEMISKQVDDLGFSVGFIDQNLKALLNNLNIEEPRISEFKSIVKSTYQRIKEHGVDEEKNILKEMIPIFPGASFDELRAIIREQIK